MMSYIKKSKLRGDSPLKLIITIFIIVFFVALFAWQIEKYLVASQDSKLQNQISRMNSMIEIASLDAFSNQKYAYLHDELDLAKPITIEDKKIKFEPASTLTTLFVKNQFLPRITRNDQCYLYIYFPPGEASDLFDFYTDRDPGYVLAAWSEFQNKPVVATSPGLTSWAEKNLTEDDFYCEAKKLKPNVAATKPDGSLLDLPGIEFQFSGGSYSQVKL